MRPRDKESRGDVGTQRVADNLFADKPVVRQVIIEYLNDVVTEVPRVRSFAVRFKAVSFSKSNDVQPMLRPTFAVTRTVENFVDQISLGVL